MLNHSRLPGDAACDGVCNCGTERARGTLVGQYRKTGEPYRLLRENHAGQKERRIKTQQTSKHQAEDARCEMRDAYYCDAVGEAKEPRGGAQKVEDGKRPDWPCGPRTPWKGNGAPADQRHLVNWIV